MKIYCTIKKPKVLQMVDVLEFIKKYIEPSELRAIQLTNELNRRHVITFSYYVNPTKFQNYGRMLEDVCQLNKQEPELITISEL